MPAGLSAPLLSKTEVAEACGVQEPMAANYMRDGWMKAVKLSNGLWITTQPELDTFIRRREEGLAAKETYDNLERQHTNLKGVSSPLITSKDIAERISYKRNWISSQFREGAVPYFPVANSYVTTERELKAWRKRLAAEFEEGLKQMGFKVKGVE